MVGPLFLTGTVIDVDIEKPICAWSTSHMLSVSIHQNGVAETVATARTIVLQQGASKDACSF